MSEHKKIQSQAFRIQEALSQLGIASDGNTIAEQVLLIEKGVSAEDEASLLFCWLGKCRLVHKLDQLAAPPSAHTDFVIPDLLAVFKYNGRDVAFLIEVKTCAANALSWRPDYMERLTNYSKLIGLPLLVACKWKKNAFRWTLTEACHFEKGPTNYKLSSERAILFNLMFDLAGNFALVFKEGITWHTKLRRSGPSPPVPGKKNTFTMTARFEDEEHYTDGTGQLIEAIDKRLWTFFMGKPEPFTESGDIIDLKFVNPKNFFKSADRVLESLLSSGKEPPYWRELLRNYGIPPDASEILDLARKRKDIVEKILIMRSRELPEILKEGSGRA